MCVVVVGLVVLFVLVDVICVCYWILRLCCCGRVCL